MRLALPLPVWCAVLTRPRKYEACAPPLLSLSVYEAGVEVKVEVEIEVVYEAGVEVKVEGEIEVVHEVGVEVEIKVEVEVEIEVIKI